MDDRYNTIEGQLDTDLNAESDITDEFNTIERKFREDYTTYYKHELPSLSYKILEANPADNDDHKRNLYGIIEINVMDAKLEDAEEKVKELISLVEDFLMSDSWTYAFDTKVGRSGFLTASSGAAFLANGAVEFEVEVDLPSSTVK